MTTSTLNVTELDFETIKASLKAWMSQSDEFKDYDFEASGLSFFLDTLAYNTHYNAVLANFMANEMFLDTAQKRSSVVSHAKSLGYHPRSYHGARAVINIEIDSLNLSAGFSAPDTFVLRRGTAFTTTVGNTYYEFVTITDYSAQKTIDGKYFFDNVEIVEGVFNTYAWQVADEAFNLMYTIPNPRVDNSTIKMQVYPSNTSIENDQWFLSSTLFNVDETSNMFFVQESFGEKTEIYFGNGTVGNKPAKGNVIRIEYVSTNGSGANGAKVFTPSRGLYHNGISDVAADSRSITLVQQSEQGANSESIDEIKYSASKHFTVQNRAITPFDYVSIIRENFYNIEAIKVWGGEDNIPAYYNTVFVCIKPIYGEYLTESEKRTIKNIIADRAIMNMGVTFVNPDYINIVLESTVYFTPSKLKVGSDLSAIVKSALLYYSDTELEAFNKQFRYSNMTSIIDESDSAVNNNITSVKMYKVMDIELGKGRSYTVNFINTLDSADGSVESSSFYSSISQKAVVFKNLGTAMILGYYDDQSNKFVVLKEIGSLDYKTGSITINTINILSVNGSELRMYARPQTNDMISLQSNILRLKNEDINIKLVADIPNQLRIQST